MDLLISGYKQLAMNIWDSPLFPIGCLAVVVVCAMTVYHHWLMRQISGKREAGMTRNDRSRMVKQVFADAITNAAEELVHKKMLTADEAQRWYRRFEFRCQLYDLAPKKLSPEPTVQVDNKPLVNGHAEPVNELDVLFDKHII